MSRLTWGLSRSFSEGVDRCVLYLASGAVPWSGVVSVAEGSNAETTETLYLDGLSYGVRQSQSDYNALVEAYTYPKAFEEYDGFSNTPSPNPFGFSYRATGSGGGFLHIVYNVTARPNNRSWSSIESSATPSLFSWNLSARPQRISSAQATAHFVVNRDLAAEATADLEKILYGDDIAVPRLPTVEEVQTIFNGYATLQVQSNADGTFTINGPDSMVRDNLDGTFTINSPSLYFPGDNTFAVSSY